MKTQQRQKGVTLLELLVVVAIISILALISLPNIPYIITSQRIRTSNNDIVAKFRGFRQLAISKGRKLKVDFDVTNQWMTVSKLAYTEYNVVDEIAEKDLVTTVADEGGISGFELFTEEEEILHVIPRWNKEGTPIPQVPINYALQDGQTNKYNGVDKMRVITGSSPPDDFDDTGATDANKITLYPSGTFDDTYTIMIKNVKYDRLYTITLYKAGQIRSSSVQ